MHSAALVTLGILVLAGPGFGAASWMAETSGWMQDTSESGIVEPTRILPGADYAAAQVAGFVGTWDGTGAPVYALSGGTVTIDQLVDITSPNGTQLSFVSSARGAQARDGVASASSTWRFWTGFVAPTSDEDYSVCTLLTASTQSGTCTGPLVHAQLVLRPEDPAADGDVLHWRAVPMLPS